MSIYHYPDVVKFLESLNIMPKTMPGLEKIKLALAECEWFSKIDPNKVIVVAGTNGKGSTCAALEALLFKAKMKVGLYTSPHLISTTERIRLNKKSVSEVDFVNLFNDVSHLIEKYQLTHFESLTLMAANYFFNRNDLDYAIFEVGLGGTFDATNAIPHTHSVITSLGLDHQNILGYSLSEIAQNKFGIIQKKSKVYHHRLPDEVMSDFVSVIQSTESVIMPSIEGFYSFENQKWILNLNPSSLVRLNQEQNSQNKCEQELMDSEFYVKCNLSLVGPRGAENALTALAVFKGLGFDILTYREALNEIDWPGRMQPLDLAQNFSQLKNTPVYLSGDHNVQGIQSLVAILKYYEWNTLHCVLGVGLEKDIAPMFFELSKLPRVKFYLTQTPFKGRSQNEYPHEIQQKSEFYESDVSQILKKLNVQMGDMVLITGSLYLVGEALKLKKS